MTPTGSSRRGWRAAVLTYHTLDESGGVLATSPGVFAEQMRALAEAGVRVVPLEELAAILSGRDSDQPAVALTFDDGFRSVCEHALPVLGRHGFPATVFIVTDYCGRTNAWPSQRAHIARHPLLSWDELRELARAGVALGCHTRSHPDLRKLSARELEREVTGAKADMEDRLGVAVESFAYPYGAFDRRVQTVVAGHFSLACATTLGFVGPHSDRLAIERLDMYYLQRPALLAHLFTPWVAGYLRLRRALRDARAGYGAAS